MTSLKPLAEASRRAARVLAVASTPQKDEALRAMANALREASAAICEANAADVAAASAAGKSAAFIDRLTLDGPRVEAMAKAVEAVCGLVDPVGEVTERWTRPNGLAVRKVRLPLGVVLMIYESRPNVTSDAAALCLKSGNAVILRGGSESFASNQAIARALVRGVEAAGLPAEAVQLVPSTDRESLLELLTFEGLIDLCIPRGGEGLIRFVAQHARVPVVKHYRGVCHVYVHAAADLAMAERLIVNAKTSRPGVCNAAECLLVDQAVAATFLPSAGRALVARGVELRGDEETVRLLRAAEVPVKPARPDDFGKEFLDLILAVKVVRNLDEALAHIARYGSEHTEAIVTADQAAAQRFVRDVCASAVMVNASTRFNDGGELGLGAEVGISTSRLHAFGPMGLKELTAQKYVVEGDGHVRQ
jgi:glutamate-5-semialdehyde dehydrogenase